MMHKIFGVVVAVLLSGCAAMGTVNYGAAPDPNAKGMFGMTPVYEAAYANDAAAVRQLLARGGNPDAMTSMGMCPLLVAIWGGKTEVVKALVEGGANVNIVNPGYKATPLIYCGAYGNAEIARILLDAGADPDARDAKGKSAADYAVEYKKDEVLAVLSKGGVPVSYTGDGKRDVVMAALTGDKKKMQELLDAGIDPNIKTKSGKSLLAYAVENKWPDIAGTLIKKGADVNEPDATGWTLMMTAAWNNMDEIVKAFESAGVQRPYNGDRHNDILIAVLFGDREKAKALLAQGASANGLYRYKSPLLSYAAYKNDQEMVRLLLDHGANPNVVNEHGWSPVVIAIDKGGPSFGKIFFERGAAVTLPSPREHVILHAGIRTGDIEFVKYLLGLGAQPDIDAVLLAQGKIQGAERVNDPQIAALIRPEVVRRQMLRAQAAVEAAQSPADYQKAIQEYSIAKDLDSSRPEVYYNLGLVQEKTAAYNDAITSFRKYLELVPNAPDAQEVKDMIYKLEYKRDQAGG